MYCFAKEFVYSEHNIKNQVFHQERLPWMWLYSQFLLDLVTFTEKSLLENFIVCAVDSYSNVFGR